MQTKPREDILALAAQLATTFDGRAAQHDAEGRFPHENYDDLRAAGWPLLTVPAERGGWGAGLLTAVMAHERLAVGDGSTALSIGMHVQTVGAAASAAKDWDRDTFAYLCAEIVERRALVNSCASEPELGSPSRGGLPKTTARRSTQGDVPGWYITGRKAWASMSPTLDYFIIPAHLEGTEDQIGLFLVARGPGVQVIETWDGVGMRTTGSNDIILTEVFVGDNRLISQRAARPPDPTRVSVNAWFSGVGGAVYLGVATAAMQAAARFANGRVPTALGRPIATLENIQRHIGMCEYELQVARAVLHRAADLWDTQPERRGDAELQELLSVAKVSATNAAIRVVDSAMRAVGGVSMTHALPLERYYRDVRAGLFHPPFDDTLIPLLGRVVLGKNTP